MFIPDPDQEFCFSPGSVSRIQGSKKHRTPDPGSAILHIWSCCESPWGCIRSIWQKARLRIRFIESVSVPFQFFGAKNWKIEQQKNTVHFLQSLRKRLTNSSKSLKGIPERIWNFFMCSLWKVIFACLFGEQMKQGWITHTEAKFGTNVEKKLLLYFISISPPLPASCLLGKYRIRICRY